MSLELKAKLNEMAHLLYNSQHETPKPVEFDFSKSLTLRDCKIWHLACDTYNFWHPAPKIRPPRKKVSK